MGSDVSLRRARAADAPDVAGVHRVSRASYYGVHPGSADDARTEMWSALLSQPERSTYLAEAPGPVGFISMIRTNEGEAPVLQLTSLYVHPTYFGGGVGSLLYDEFEHYRRPAEAGVLEVWAGNQRAIAFYQRRGWVATDRIRPGPQNQPYVTFRLA